ncbi:MAG: competence protein TfoX [Bacteroidales bacterium]|nr:MAG: competence protein TfoX [Bacteroidales bacterium]
MDTSSNELSSLPNIGKNLVEKLIQVGIETPNQLKSIGSENAFARIKVIDCGACINMLFALEGAIQGIRWHNLDSNRKNELNDFYSLTQKIKS